MPAALLAGLTRPQGVLLAIPLAWEAFLVLRANGYARGHRKALALAIAAACALYVAPQLFLITAGGPATPLASASRYMLAMFPIFVVLGLLGRRRWFHTSWQVASVLGLGLLLASILQNVPVG